MAERRTEDEHELQVFLKIEEDEKTEPFEEAGDESSRQSEWCSSQEEDIESQVDGGAKRVRFDFKEEEIESVNEEMEKNTDENSKGKSVAQVPSLYIGKPLVDYDAGKRRVPSNHTFLVVRRQGNACSDNVYRFNKASSLGLLGPLNPIRQFAISVVTNRYFESFVILTILVNCVFLVLEHPPDEAEYVFCAIYTMEMVLKILSRGFIFHTYAYLRDGWNWLDFIVVVLGYITMAPNIDNFTGIRTVRVLRALRTISALKGLRAVVNTLLRSLKLLSDVLVLFMFFLGIMALIGLQLFSGELRNKCVFNVPDHNSSVNLQERAINESFWFIYNDEPLICGNSSSAGSCPSNYTCMANAGPNPDNGYTTFDNMGWSLVMALQILTMDFWQNIYNKIIRSSGAPYVPYFVIGIFFCAFYLMNLVLAMVYLSYEQELCSDEEEREKRDNLRRTGASYQAGEETLKRLTLLDGSSPLLPQTDANINGDATTGVWSNESANKRHHLRDCLSPACVLSKSTGMRNVKCNALSHVQSYWKRVQQCFAAITNHSTFDVVIGVLIVLNTIVLAMYYHGIHPQFKRVLDYVNLVFTALFAVEILFRLIAMGPMAFIRSRWHMFDTTVVLASLLGYVISAKGLSTFRTFRLVRVLWLAKTWKTMKRLMNAIARSVGPVGNITLILSVVIYIFAVLGLKVFGKAYTPDKFGDDGVPRWNFSDIWHAFMMVFRVLCGEMIEPLWDCMKATSAAKAILFFLAVLIVGNFVVLNLFVALMVNAFDSKDKEHNSNKNSLQPVEGTSRCSIKKVFQTRKSPLIVENCRKPFRLCELQVLQSSPCSDENTGGSLATCKAEHYRKETDNACKESLIDIENTNTTKTEEEQIAENGADFSPNGTLTIGFKMAPEDRTISDKGAESSAQVTSRHTMEIDDCLPEYCACVDCPLWKPLSTPNFCWLMFRGRLRVFVEKKYFEWFILATVFCSSLTLCFEDVHLHEKPKLAKALEILNYVFAAIFTLEFILKSIGLGLTKYFSSAWNCLDAFIVSIALACLFENKNLAVFRSLRTLRALRPLRAISRLEGMKVVVNALFAAIPGIGNVLLVSVLFWVIFSILGVHLFAGKFYKCVNEDNEQLSASVIANKAECLNHTDGYRWVNSKVTFDNVLAGFIALMQVATFEGWMEVMKDAVDSTEVDMQPKFENKLVAYCFFVAFIVVGSFFVLNLFVGVIIDNFNTLKKKYEDINSMGMLLTDTQRKWVSFLKEAARKKPPTKEIRPQMRLCGLLYDVVTGDKFEIAIMIVIICNMLMMTIQHHEQSPQVSSVLRLSNFVFTGIFLLEAIVKIIALNLRYFKKAWNVFDFIIVISSVVDVMLDEFKINDGAVSPSLLRILRIFRIARLLRLVQFAKGIRQLLWALMISLPALLNVGTLLFLVIFIYAIIGMSAFGNVKQEGELNDTVNFGTFGSSLLLLFRLATGAGWNDIMEALLLKPPDCDPNYLNLPHGNCGSFSAVIYLLSYIIVVSLVIINMYIAIILENVYRAHEIEDFCITKENFDSYYVSWGEFVPDGKQYVPLDKLSEFVAYLDKPFKIPQPNSAVLEEMNIPVISGELVHCFALLKTLVKRVLEKNGESPEVFQTITAKMEASFKSSFKRKLNNEVTRN